MQTRLTWWTCRAVGWAFLMCGMIALATRAETLVIPDVSGNANDIVFDSAPTFEPGCLGYRSMGLRVGGELEYGLVQANDVQKLTTFTIQGFIIWDGTHGGGASVGDCIASKGGGAADAGRSWSLAITKVTNALHGVVWYNDTNGRIDLEDPNPLPANVCVHIALAVTPMDSVKLYRDGVMVASAPFPYPSVNYAVNSPIEFANNSGTCWFNGVLEDFRLSRVARTDFAGHEPLTVDPATVALWRFEPQFTVSDLSGNWNDITFLGQPSYVTTCGMTGIQIDGETSFGTVPPRDLQRLPEFSVEMLLNWSGIHGSGPSTGDCIVAKGGTSPDPGRSWGLSIDKVTSALRGFVWFNATNGRIDLVDSQPFPANQCVRVALVVKPHDSVRLYRDGTLVASAPFPYASVNYEENSPVEFANNNGTCWFEGTLVGARLSDVARTAFPSEGGYALDSHTVGLWSFDEEFLLRDISGNGNHATMHGSPIYLSDCGGTTLQVNGRQNYGTVPVREGLKPREMSMEMVVRWDGIHGDGASTGDCLSGMGCDALDPGRSWGIAVTKATNALHAVVWFNSENGRIDLEDPAPLPQGRCVHVALTVKPFDRVRLYRDGVEVASAPFPYASVNYAEPSPITFLNCNNTCWFIGELGDCRLSDIARASFILDQPLGMDSHTIALWRSRPGNPVSDILPLETASRDRWISISMQNPAPGALRVLYQSPESGTAEMSIVDVGGRVVHSWTSEMSANAVMEHNWDCRSDAGSRIPNGIYFIRAQVGPLRGVRKVLVIKG